jgi:hypothetical protein
LNRKLIFLIFCTVFVVGAAHAQTILAPKLLSLSFKPLKKKPFNLLSLNHIPARVRQPAINLIAPDFSTSNFGFFCRQELKFEKITKIPFRFRLGSVIACDRMEGKRVPSSLSQ